MTPASVNNHLRAHLQPFVVIRTTGWVMSDKAIREIGLENLQVRRRSLAVTQVLDGQHERLPSVSLHLLGLYRDPDR